MDGVADVAVFGIPDDDLGEALAAHVQPVPGARDHRGARPAARARAPRVVQGAEGRGAHRAAPAGGDRQAVQAPAPGGVPLSPAHRLMWSNARALVVVEGESDRVALRTLARRLGRDLEREGVEVVDLAGATNVGRWLEDLAATGASPTLAGLYDAPEERFFRRGLERGGRGPVPDRARLEELGFFACEPDLEHELIRALGEDAVEAVIEAQGELPSLRILQHQPAQRDAVDRPAPAPVHRRPLGPQEPLRAAARRGARPRPRPHAAGPCAQPGVSPVESRTDARATCAGSQSRLSTWARLKTSCASCSQVIAMPPCSWTVSEATWSSASEQ